MKSNLLKRIDKYVAAVFALAVLLAVATLIEASDSVTISHGATQNITAHSTCRRVTNGSATALSVYVPTQIVGEWESFYSAPPTGVSVSLCAPKVVFITSGTTWTVPTDFSNVNTIEVIGGGGGGQSGNSSYRGGGGGGGGYSRIDNVSLTPGSTIAIQVGARGGIAASGGDTYLCNSMLNCTSINGAAVVVGAKGGAGAFNQNGGVGGAALAGIGAIKYSGGSGGGSGSYFGSGGGGGGAAGPNGDGGIGGQNTALVGGGGGGGSNGGGSGQNGGSSYGASAAGNGGNNRFGYGGGSGGDNANTPPGIAVDGGGGGGEDSHVVQSPTTPPGHNAGTGSMESIWTQTSNGVTAGSGGGGGGAAPQQNNTAGNGGTGADYGGGGGGTGFRGGRYLTGVGGVGGQGIIVISYY